MRQLAAALLLLTTWVSAQEISDENPSSPAAPAPTDNLRSVPPDAYRINPAVGIPYRTIFRDTGAPYTSSLRPLDVEPTIHVGAVDAAFKLDLPDFRARFPLLDRGFDPEDADLKIGPVYLKVRALTAAMLFSDNVERSETDADADAIAITRIAATIVAQLTEGFRVSASGNLVYLPLEGKLGIAGFPLVAPYSFGLEGSTDVESQVVWDTMIGGWNVVFADDFRMAPGRFSLSTRDDFEFFEGGDFDDVDRAGRYTFRARSRTPGQSGGTSESTDLDFIYNSNVASITTERLLPGPVRLRIRAFRENLWYNQGYRGLPRLREGATALLRSERENQRFKPFLYYRTVHANTYDGFDQEVRVGIDGPITDQLKLHLDAGVHHRTQSNSNRFLYGVALEHIAGPYTNESLAFVRRVNDLSEEVIDRASYRFHQILGPKLEADAFVGLGRSMDLDDESSREEFRTGARLTTYLGPRTTVRAGYTFSRIETDDGNFGNQNDGSDFEADDSEEGDSMGSSRKTHTFRLEVIYHWSDSLLSRLIYQHQKRESNHQGDSYDENLVFVSLTKYFD